MFSRSMELPHEGDKRFIHRLYAETMPPLPGNALKKLPAVY